MEKTQKEITPAMWIIIAVLGGIFFAYTMYQDAVMREINASTVGYEMHDLSVVSGPRN